MWSILEFKVRLLSSFNASFAIKIRKSNFAIVTVLGKSFDKEPILAIYFNHIFKGQKWVRGTIRKLKVWNKFVIRFRLLRAFQMQLQIGIVKLDFLTHFRTFLPV